MGYWREFTFQKSPVGWLTPSVDPRHTPAPKFPPPLHPPGIKANRARSSVEQQQQRVVAIDLAILTPTGRVLHGQVVFSCRRRPETSNAQTQAQTLTRKPIAAPSDLAMSRQKQGRLSSGSAYHASSSLQPATDCRTSKTLDATDDGGGGDDGHGENGDSIKKNSNGNDDDNDGGGGGGGGGVIGVGRGDAGDNTAVAWVWGKQE
ncbi:hypothetical protein COCCADRAFT_23689 [Bipolaris zeicola 26-R-13]|uniref:Uncharacterized protein n=1 Tax=Cochliobolus carbonum (strain 26-R-13) TaxID=930089 RepID=W6YFW6_COCC2|nr:uncharacterized protein COCCADRAFT_23689 [Bipolaris zeicola 26-R-13]EUC36575.1 hypothetical protein COCCADRAFT_23689 [Bipolaris zeicola 26-R-13]